MNSSKLSSINRISVKKTIGFAKIKLFRTPHLPNTESVFIMKRN